MRLLAISVAMLALAGCGGDGGGSPAEGDYPHGLISALGGVEEPTSLDRESLAALADDYGEAAERLSALTPPPSIAETHARMVAAMRSYADRLDRASGLTGDQAAYVSEMSLAQVDAEAWTREFETIKARGYASVPAS